MIEVVAVSKSYGAKQALDRVSMSASDGMVTGFVGPNGAGKSTLLRVIAKLTAADAGTVSIDGQEFGLAKNPGSSLGVFLSAEWIPAQLTARSLLTYVCDVQSLDRRRADEMLEDVDLAGVREKRVRTFSLGMRQRLGIAAAILARPRNLILDEPINGLDPDAIKWLRRSVRTVAAAGGSVLLSSHHMSELVQIADHVVMLDHGRVIRTGPMRALLADDLDRTYFEADDPEAAQLLMRVRGFRCEPYESGIVVYNSSPQEVGRTLFQHDCMVTELRRLKRSLEEAYFDEISVRRASVKVER